MLPFVPPPSVAWATEEIRGEKEREGEGREKERGGGERESILTPTSFMLPISY